MPKGIRKDKDKDKTIGLKGVKIARTRGSGRSPRVKSIKQSICPYVDCKRRDRSQQGVLFTPESLQRHIRMAHRDRIKEVNKETNSYSPKELEEAESLAEAMSLASSFEGLIMPDGTVIAPDGTELHNRAFISEDEADEGVSEILGFLNVVKLTYVEAEAIISAVKLSAHRGQIEKEREERREKRREERGRENFSWISPPISLDKKSKRG